MSALSETVRFVQWLQHQNDAANDMRNMSAERLEAELWAWKKRNEAPLPPTALERNVEREHAKATAAAVPTISTSDPVVVAPVAKWEIDEGHTGTPARVRPSPTRSTR
jgi:hypothetical protein